MPWLINPTQLENFRKSQKNLIIFDASWHLPLEDRNPREEFEQEHLKDAHFFDIDLFNDPEFPLENRIIQDETIISERLGSLGIKNDYKIIFYDNSPLRTACRAIWMMKLFGHSPQQLYVLNGGYQAWKNYGGKIESGTTIPSVKNYNAKWQNQFFCSLAQMKENFQHPKIQVIDTRHPVRFSGGPESRPGVRSGHIPDSFSFPYFSVMGKEGEFLPIEKIRRRLIEIGIDLNLPIITMCGSAITSPIINFILDLMNHQEHSVYNGSWAEWGSTSLFPGESSLDERPIASCLDETHGII